MWALFKQSPLPIFYQNSENALVHFVLFFAHSDFMALCHNLKAVKSAQTLWHDQEFMDMVEFVDPMTGDLAMNMAATTDTYLVKISVLKLVSKFEGLKDIGSS